jgi:formylglycine-generating enzyme required for sulfatase activity
VPDFELMRGEVTVAQYRACVTAGACDAPGCTDAQVSGGGENEVILCNYSQNRNDHPVNYVSWINARQFSTWVGARLPSESEWEFAAKSRGQNITYPWGDAEPNCERANFSGCDGDDGAGTSRVCSHAAGNSDQGLCDLAGNVWEWIQDERHADYNGAPVDGSAWGADANNGASRVRRGGAFNVNATSMRAANRNADGPTIRSYYLGFRLAR